MLSSETFKRLIEYDALLQQRIENINDLEVIDIKIIKVLEENNNYHYKIITNED